MKTIISTLFLLIVSAGLTNETKAQSASMQNFAREYMSRRMGHPVTFEEKKTARPLFGGIKKNTAETNVLAYNVTGGGWIIVAENNDKPYALGYCCNGYLNTDELPEPLTEWIKASATSEIMESDNQKYTAVAPLIKTQWGQDVPYNRNCPTLNNAFTVTGCTATATAQVLYYYRSNNTSPYIMEYMNEPTSTEISVDYGKGNYDWDNMLTNYEEGQYTDAQANAVARLMFEAGVACKSKYNLTTNYVNGKATASYFSTSGKIPFVALNRYFNYDCHFLFRSGVPTGRWMQIIQEELLAGRPIIYGGNSTTSGHNFIVDGIDENGLCHINWGWRGSGDGFYDINRCQASGPWDEGYFRIQSMIVGIRPRTATETYHEQLVCAGIGQAHTSYSAGGGWLASGINQEYTTTNFYPDGRDSGIGSPNYYSAVHSAALYKDGTLYRTYENKDLKNWGSAFDGYNSYMGAFGAGSQDEIENWGLHEDGDYEVHEFYEDFITPRHEVAFHHSLQPRFSIRNGKIHLENILEKNTYRNWPTVTFHEIKPVEKIYNGTYFYLALEAEIQDTLPESSLPDIVFTFTNTETGKTYTADARLEQNIYPGVRVKSYVKIKPVSDTGLSMKEGTYTLDLSCNNAYEPKYQDIQTFTVLPKPEYPILDVQGNPTYGDLEVTSAPTLYLDNNRMPYDGSISNTSVAKFWPNYANDNVVGGNVQVNIYAGPESGGEELFIASLEDVEILSNPNSFISWTRIELPYSLYPLEGDYSFSWRYCTPEGERGFQDPYYTGQPVTVYSNSAPASLLQATSQSLSITAEDNSVLLPLTNQFASDFNGQILLEVKNKQGLVRKSATTCQLAPNETKEIRLTLPLLGDGNYDVYLASIPANNQLGTPVISDTEHRTHIRLNVGTTGIGYLPSEKPVTSRQSATKILSGKHIYIIDKQGNQYHPDGRKKQTDAINMETYGE